MVSAAGGGVERAPGRWFRWGDGPAQACTCLLRAPRWGPGGGSRWARGAGAVLSHGGLARPWRALVLPARAPQRKWGRRPSSPRQGLLSARRPHER